MSLKSCWDRYIKECERKVDNEVMESEDVMTYDDFADGYADEHEDDYFVL